MKIKSLFVGDTDNTFIQFFRYCFVGGFAFVVDFGVMTLLTEVFSVYPVVSSTVSFVAGLLVNYLLSTFWIFKNSKIKNRFAEKLSRAKYDTHRCTRVFFRLLRHHGEFQPHK